MHQHCRTKCLSTLHYQQQFNQNKSTAPNDDKPRIFVDTMLSGGVTLVVAYPQFNLHNTLYYGTRKQQHIQDIRQRCPTNAPYTYAMSFPLFWYTYTHVLQQQLNTWEVFITTLVCIVNIPSCHDLVAKASKWIFRNASPI